MTSSPLVHRFHTAPQAVSLHSSHHSSAGISWIFVVVVILITISTAESIQKLVPNLTHFSLAPFEYRSSKESESVLVYNSSGVVDDVPFRNNTLQTSAEMCSDCKIIRIITVGVHNISEKMNSLNVSDHNNEDDSYFRNNESFLLESLSGTDEMMVNSRKKHEFSRKSVRSNSVSVMEEHISTETVTKLPHIYKISPGTIFSEAKESGKESKIIFQTENSYRNAGSRNYTSTDDFAQTDVTPVANSEWNSNEINDNYRKNYGGETLPDGHSDSSDSSVYFSNISLIRTEVSSPSVSESYSLDYYSNMEFRKVREFFQNSKRTNSMEASAAEANFPNFMGFPLEPPRHLLDDSDIPKVISRSLTKTGDDFSSTPNQEKSKSAGNLTEKVSILGLFEMSNRWGDRPEGRSELAAAKLAVRHVNKREVLPGFHLELHTNDTKCDPGVGVDAFFHALYTQNTTRTVMLLGSACSDVTESLAKVVPYWNIVQVSFGSTSPSLSDRREFPLFCRTVAPDSSHNPARLAFVKRFGWDTVTALSQNEDVYSLAVNDLVTELEQANITCRSTITFAESDFKDQLRLLRDLDTRIIIGSFSPKVAPKIFCEAHQLGMFGADYAWILQGGPGSNWWRNASEHCPQLSKAVEGLLLVSSHNSLVGDIPAVSGLTNAGFLEEFSRLSLPVTRYTPQTYDAVWAMALALGAAHRKWQSSADHQPSMRNFDYNRKDMADEFLRQMNSLNFLGASGPVSFNGADRVGISAFYQVQGGEVEKVALYYPETSELNFSCPGCKKVYWHGGQVPVARREFRLRVVTIDTAAFMSVSCISVVGISLAVAFLAFNLHFRKLKYIKLSSPRLNNMAVVGCILVYTAVILLGLDHATLPTSMHFPTVCTARVYLLSAGFSLAFGSMFTKTYRVHRIFTRSRSGVVKNKLLQDTQLISLICVLLLIDGLIVTLWVIIDPIQRHLRNLTLEISASDRSVVYQPQVEVCRSQYINGWLGALYVYKGLLLVVGVYMAWETRHVKIPALNDSQYIGMSVYSVVITSAIVVVLANLISERATLAFVTITALILTSTTTTLCLLFLPKLHAILGRAAHADPIVHSMGLKIECNTRRFVMDDRRELYYRVEVQNRVYRREMAALDLEIGRLRRQLIESPTASSGGSTSSMGASRRGELSPLDVTALARLSLDENSLQPSAGVGGGLPMLLLSVLPPVIPRASWPSADPGALHMRRQVTFSSEPKLDDSTITKSMGADSGEDFCRYDPDTPLSETSAKLGVFSRLWSFLGSKPSSRKTSAASFTGGATGSIASALRMHMGYLAGIVPNSNNPNAMTSSCNTSATMINQYGLAGGQSVAASSRELHPLKKLCGRTAGGSGPIISVTSNDEHGIDSIIFDGSGGRRKFSLGMCLSRKDEKELEEGVAPRVSLPLQKLRIQHQHSQPILPFRERAKGSPRFPHKIVPTCSLNALEDRRKSSSSAGGSSYGGGASSAVGSNFYAQFVRRRSSQHHLHVKSKHYDQLLGDKCRSLEDARTLDVTRSGSGSASSGAAQSATGAPSTSNWKPRAASYSPNCDVWGTAEFGIPLSELGSGTRTRDRSAPSCVVPPEGLTCQ